MLNKNEIANWIYFYHTILMKKRKKLMHTSWHYIICIKYQQKNNYVLFDRKKLKCDINDIVILFTILHNMMNARYL